MSAEPELPPARSRRQAISSVWVDPAMQHSMPGEYFMDEERQVQQVSPSLHRSMDQVQVQQLSPAPSPIPPRASAVRSGLSKIRPHTAPFPVTLENDVTRTPTVPHAGSWQHETSAFAAQSSLPMLSLFSNGPAAPAAPTEASPRVQIDEMKTQPPRPPVTSGRLPSVGTERPEVSWTAGTAANSHFARAIASAKKSAHPRGMPALNPVERVRWWLLYPGRMEFLLWFGGTLLLLAITCLFLFLSLLSMGWIDNRGTSGTVPTGTAGSAAHSTHSAQCAGTACQGSAANMPRLSLLTADSLQSFRLQGQGFSHNAPITLTHDDNQQCEPAWIATDAQGSFTVTVLMMNSDGAWPMGPHVIQAFDTLSKRAVTVTVVLVATTSGPAAPPPVAGIAATTTPPLATTPTVGTTPVATPTPPKATPTTTATVMPSPTADIKPTPTHSSHVVVAQSMSLQDGAAGPGLPVGLLLALIVVGYSLALLLLGLAGLLYHRQHK